MATGNGNPEQVPEPPMPIEQHESRSGIPPPAPTSPCEICGGADFALHQVPSHVVPGFVEEWRCLKCSPVDWKRRGEIPLSSASAARVGFHELTEADQRAIVLARELGGHARSLLEWLEVHCAARIPRDGSVTLTVTEAGRAITPEDARWLGLAKDHFQQGLMAAVRAVAQPGFF